MIKCKCCNYYRNNTDIAGESYYPDNGVCSLCYDAIKDYMLSGMQSKMVIDYLNKRAYKRIQ